MLPVARFIGYSISQVDWYLCVLGSLRITSSVDCFLLQPASTSSRWFSNPLAAAQELLSVSSGCLPDFYMYYFVQLNIVFAMFVFCFSPHALIYFIFAFTVLSLHFLAKALTFSFPFSVYCVLKFV